MITEAEQHGEGIDMGVAPEVIQERKKMWSNVRKDLRDQIQREFAEDLNTLEGKKLTSAINDLVRAEVRRRVNKGEFKDLREKVMYESWDILESAHDVEKMTPFAVENMLEKFVESAKKSQSPAEREQQEHKKKFELSKKAQEVFEKLPEEPDAAKAEGEMGPEEQREFALFVTGLQTEGKDPGDFAGRWKLWQEKQEQEDIKEEEVA